MGAWCLYGNGGHARVLSDVLRLRNEEVVCVFDDTAGTAYSGDLYREARLVISVGNNKVREKIALGIHHVFGVLVHPSAVVADDVELGEGSVVLASAVIQAGARIGCHVIVNAGAVIDHDAVIEDYVSVYPGAYIGGGANVEKYVTVGPNEVVPRLSTRRLQESI